jgi:hypothetical protein
VALLGAGLAPVALRVAEAEPGFPFRFLTGHSASQVLLDPGLEMVLELLPNRRVGVTALELLAKGLDSISTESHDSPSGRGTRFV